MLCCGYTLTDFPISIRLTSLALWQSNGCPRASKAALMNMDKYFMWIHYERLHNHNKAKHNKTVCIFLGIYCIQTTGLLRTKVACLRIYMLNWVLTNFPYKHLWTIMDTQWTVVITQPQSIVVGKHFTVTIIKLLNVISRIPIIQVLPIYFCTNSWNVRAAICLEGHLSLLALSSVYSLTVEDGSWSTLMVPAQLCIWIIDIGRNI